MDPAIGEAMQKQTQLMEEQNNWYQNTVYPWLQKQTQLQNEANEEDRQFSKDNTEWWKNYYTTQTEKQNARSDELYNRYLEYYKPIEDQLVEEAKEYNTSAKAASQAQNAMDTTAGQYNQQRQTTAMRMKAYGIDTGNNLYSEQARTSAINQAAAQTQAANQARQSAIDLGWQKQLQVAQLGSSYLGNSLNLTSLANNTASTGNAVSNSALSQASTYGQQTVSNVNSLANIGLSSYQNMSNAWGSYGQMGQSKTNYNQQVQNAKDQASAQKASGIAAGVGTAVTVAAVAI